MSYATTTREFFEDKYKQTGDPWNFENSSYERGRYNATLTALGDRRYKRGFEPGCSIGVLTRSLASRCEQLEAIDISPTAAARAAARCRSLSNVTVQCGSLPEAIPEGKFDLIVLSEIGYYFEGAVLEKIVQSLVDRLIPSGTLIAAHWLGTSADHILSGNEVHEIVRQNHGLGLENGKRFPRFRLDRMVRR